MASVTSEPAAREAGIGAFAGGMAIGTLGGLIGLGGAEFRLPLLLGLFRFGPLEAVIVNLLAGSLLGAWVGASWAPRLRSETLYRVIAVLLVAIAGILLIGHNA